MSDDVLNTYLGQLDAHAKRPTPQQELQCLVWRQQERRDIFTSATTNLRASRSLRTQQRWIGGIAATIYLSVMGAVFMQQMPSWVSLIVTLVIVVFWPWFNARSARIVKDLNRYVDAKMQYRFAFRDTAHFRRSYNLLLTPEK